MKLDVSIPQSSVNRIRKLLRPSGTAAFCAVILLAVLAFLLDSRFQNPVHRVLQTVLLVLGVTIAWLGIGRPSGSARPIMQIFVVAALISSFLQSWLRIPSFDLTVLQMFLVTAAAILYGARDAFLLIGVMTLLTFANPGSSAGSTAAFLVKSALDLTLLSATALVAAKMTSGQRRKIASLREELFRTRSNPFASVQESAPKRVSTATRKIAVADDEIETLDASLRAILQRIREYFRAHSVLLFQPHGSRALALRHWVSDAPVDSCVIIDLQASLLGRIFARGISCSWNLDDPDCSVTLRDIPYYCEWQPVRNLAGSPLKLRDQTIGILVVDRTAPSAFTELEILHIETFAIQLVEMIEMGKRYLEQVDRNKEYRLFYRAMSELGQSLATEEVLTALAQASQDVVLSTHVLIALSDETGLTYEIGLAYGAEKLKGMKVKSHGRTWISWLLNSDTGPLLLKDIRSHASRMPVASPREGDLPVRSVLMIPLVAKGRKMGVVLLGSTQPDYFQNWHMRILSAICSQAAANIENSLLHRRVENEAFSDGLTHLFNHRYFQERLKTEFSRARRTDVSLSLLMTDIDHFKKVNDTYGHRIGDIILQQIAGILKRTVRSEDAVARYGGEEFVIILTGSNRKGALRMAERLRLAVEKVSFYAEEHAIRISVSIGSATFPDDAQEPLDLIDCADRALYCAKEQGRNRVVAFDSIERGPVRISDLRS